MKKVFVLVLALVLALTATAAVAEAPAKTRIAYDEALSFDIACPEGYTAETTVKGAYLMIELIPADETKATLAVLVCPDEEYAALESLNSLTDEELAGYVETMLEGYNDPEWTIAETALGTKVLLINERDTAIDLAECITVYEGYTVDVYMQAAEGSEITEADVDLMIRFLSDMDFILA